MASEPTERFSVPANFASRMVRCVDALYDGEHTLALAILEDIVHESYELDRCDVCGVELTRSQALDARSMRRRGYTGACSECLHASTARAA